MQMPLRKMKILGSGFQVSMAEQDLNHSQVCACFQQVGRPAMSESVRRNALSNARVSRRFCAGIPDALVRHGLVLASVAITTGKQIGSWLLPAPVLTQRL